MANVFLLTTIAIVVSPSVNCERRAFLPNANNFLKAVPNHWKHDKEELNKNLVKNAGQPWEEMRVGPRPPPLHSNPPAQWILAQQNQLPDKGQTLRRIEQLQNKLNNQPRNNIIQTLNQPHPKPETEVKLHKNKRQKREAKLLQNGFRHKREVVINPQMQPELIMQSHIQPALLQKIDAKNVGHSLNFLFYNPNIYYPDIIGSLNNKSDQEQEKDAEKRDKRQILLMIKQQPLNLGKKPRTTPNPFIRDTNIADYEIGKVDIDKPEINVVDTMDTDSYQLGRPQSLFQYLQSLIFRIGWKYPTVSLPISKAEYVNEELHIRVKRRMSKFRRDRKQMTRKRKIGRRKKTKVRRAPIKLKKWYDKRQKKSKKGDGTYRGGRGRKPRQHKRPRNYKPPQNETSDYDYYDEDGNIKEPSGETQEGSDDAAYVSYGTGEYADTAEAEAAHQELEKEYQMQLVRERKKAERRRLSNGTIESTEEILSLPLIESKEDVSNKTKDEDGEDEEEYYDEEEGSEYEDDESSDSSSDNGGGGKKTGKTKNIDNKHTKKRSSNTKQASNRDLGYKKLNGAQHSINKYYTTNIEHLEGRKMNFKITRDQNLDSETKDKRSENIRLTAKKLNFMSQSRIPGFRNSLLPNEPSNWVPSARFKVAQDRIFKKPQSMPLKKIPDVNSVTNLDIASLGGKHLQSLQSKKVFRIIESTSRDKKLNLTSIAGDKPEKAQTFTSKTRDRKKNLISIGRNGFKRIQSLVYDPLVLTSIARHIPDLEIDIVEEKGPNSIKTNQKQSAESPTEITKKKTTNNNQAKSVKNKEDKKLNSKNIDTSKRTKAQKMNMQGSDTYEEIPDDMSSFVPDKDLGLSVPSDEVESAPDDQKKN